MKKFEDLYKEIYEKYSEEFKVSGKKINKKSVKIGIIVTIIILVILAFNLWISFDFQNVSAKYILEYAGKNIKIIGFAILAPICIGSAILLKGSKNTIDSFKNKIIYTIVNGIFKDAIYTPDRGLRFEDYNEKVYSEISDSFFSEDLIQSRALGLKVAEVTAQTEHYTSKGRKNYSPLFYGLAGVMKLDKDIGETLAVLSDGKIDKKERNITLDSKEFEDMFDVKANNNVMAMRILTSDVMMSLVDLKKIVNDKVEFVILNNKVYFRIGCPKNLFEPILNKKMIDKDILKTYYDVLANVYTLTNCIKKAVEELEM